MKAILLTALLAIGVSAGAQEAQGSKELVKRVNVVLETIVEGLFTDKLDVVVLKDEGGDFAVDADGNRKTVVKIDEDYTDLDADKIRLGARLTLNTSRWTPGKETGVGLWGQAELDREAREAKLGITVDLHTDTLALARFLIGQAVAQGWKDGLPVDADLFETVAYQSLVAASTKLATLEELSGLLVFLKSGVLGLAEADKIQAEKLGDRVNTDLDSLKAVDITYDEVKDEVVIAYVQANDPTDPLSTWDKELDLSVSEVRLTKELSQLNLEITLRKISDEDLADWDEMKDEGKGMLEAFLPSLEDPAAVASLTADIRSLINEGIDFLTDESSSLDLSPFL